MIPRPCSTCGSGNTPESPRCWICGALLERVAASATAPSAPLAAAPRAPAAVDGLFAPSATVEGYGLRLTGWLVVVLAIGMLAMLVGSQLAADWPGLLVPYAVVVIVGGVGVGATMRLHLASFRRAKHPELVRGLDVALGATATVITGVVVILAALVLVVLVAFVVLVAICFGLIAVGIH